jgi:hypothetical protein
MARMLILVLWIVTPCELVIRYPRFGGTVLNMEAICFSETWYLLTSPCSITTQKNGIYMHNTCFWICDCVLSVVYK